jgi:hypothetical protein
LLLFAVRRGKTHGKRCLPCVARRGARQRGFAVQNATVRPLSCAPTKNARQRVCRAFFGLCRALGAHGKTPVSRSDGSSLIRRPNFLFGERQVEGRQIMRRDAQLREIDGHVSQRLCPQQLRVVGFQDLSAISSGSAVLPSSACNARIWLRLLRNVACRWPLDDYSTLSAIRPGGVGNINCNFNC